MDAIVIVSLQLVISITIFFLVSKWYDYVDKE